MDLKEIQEFVNGIKDLTSLEIEEEGFYIRLKRGGEKTVVMSAPAVQTAPAAQAPASAAVLTEEIAPAFENSKDVMSPLVGIFHALEGTKAVKIGAKLKKGDVLCTVEAMKLMNDIQMPEDGEIVWIAAEEGDSVEYDQLLFKYI